MKRFVLLFLLSLISLQLAFAGNTGKIYGVVTDKNSGEPLPGVNVFIKESSMGASTDLNGEFIILNIPPGKYDIECAYVGYRTITMQGVAVQSDQTTTLEFQIIEETMELGEDIVVVADRPLVQKDLTATKTVTNADEIKAMPVETYAGVMLTQAGITQGADGAIHIRGGRSNEVAYLIDGVSAANPFVTNGLATQPATNAIQEMTVVSGAFNAEYGNAMSGVVNFTTKDGSQKFNTFFSLYSGDVLSNRTEIFPNIDDFNPISTRIFEGNFSGPLSFISNGTTFFLSARYNKSEGHYYGIREHLPSDSSNFETKYTEYQYKDDDDKLITVRIPNDNWYIERNGDNAYVPMNPSETTNLMGKFKFQLGSSAVLRAQAVFNDSWYRSYNHDYKYNPDGIATNYSTAVSSNLQFTHTLSPSTFYELRAAFNYRYGRSYLYEDPTDSRYVPSDKIKGSPSGTTFLFGGTQMGHTYQKSKTIIGKGDFTSQLDSRNLLKAGFEARLHILDQVSYTVLYDRNVYQTPTVPGTDSYARQDYLTYPQEASLYLQDKLEYSDVIINAGLRFDYFYSDARYALDILQPDGETKKADPKYMLAPRLGISFPITAKGIIHLSYGHFYQMPSFSSLYSNPNFILPVSGTPLFGNANLSPEKTVSYELGLQQQFGDRMSLDITGFYKDIRDLLAWQTIQFRSEAGDTRTYRMRLNQDYGNVKGFIISLSKRMAPGDPVAAKIDYTFQVAEGNDNSSSAFYFNALSGYEAIKRIVPLDWDQTHNLYGSITIDVWDALNIGLIGKLSTGYPYSPQLAFSLYDSEPNSDSKPLQRSVDLLASYRIPTKSVTYNIFLKVYNLFDTLNERYVFDDTGRASYTFYNRVTNEPESFKNHYGEPGVHTYDEYNIRPQYYRSPRTMLLGFSLEF
jgi:outer membrane receptor protein involved in Fe transport